MLYNKLINHLQAFDKPLLKKFNAYLQSPYFNTTPAAAEFFTYLEKLQPEFDEKKLQPEIISKKIPALFDLNKQKKAGSQLLKAVEHFLALEEWQKKERAHPLYLLQAQKQLGLEEAFYNTAQKYAGQLEQCPEKDLDYFQHKHLLTETEHNRFNARLQRNPKNNLHPITQTLDTAYAVKKLRYHCELLSRHQILGTPYQPENIAQLLQELQPVTNTAYPYVYLFANVYQMLAAGTFEESEKHSQLLYRFIDEGHYTTLPQGVKETIPYIINYCLYWNNLGHTKAGTNALWWYRFKMKHNLLLENHLLQPSDYRNIVSLAIINGKKPEWLKKFMDTYTPHLPAEHLHINRAFAQAQYFYYIKNYEAAMPLFQQAQAKDEPIFNMIVRRWQYICMYEQNPESKQVLLDFLLSWERMLHRTAPELHQLKQVFGKVIYYSKKLLAANEQKIKKQTAQALEQEPFFAGKNWLLQQLKK